MKIKDLHFYQEGQAENDKLYLAYYCGYRITVLDRLTGFGWRDTETGLRDYRLNDEDGFWLASGNFDIRDFGDWDIEKAVEKIKENANTVIPKTDLNDPRR